MSCITASSRKALSAYRNSLRATKLAFSGDEVVLKEARKRIRDGFNERVAGDIAMNRIKELDEISLFLTKNIVQAKQNDTGKYVLNIHKKTELGDNESIKKSSQVDMGSLAGVGASKCCGGSGRK